MTKLKIEIRPSSVLPGWDVFVNGVWHERFQRKGRAQLEARALRGAARFPNNIERAAHPGPRKSHIGYGRGLVWRIHRNGSGLWEAVDQEGGPHFERAGSLVTLSVKIA